MFIQQQHNVHCVHVPLPLSLSPLPLSLSLLLAVRNQRDVMVVDDSLQRKEVVSDRLTL